MSCNAYLRSWEPDVGAKALLDTANLLRASAWPIRRRGAKLRDALPQASYGQGRVVASR